MTNDTKRKHAQIARRLRRWIKALRSGEYTQGEGTLIAGDGTFCCLGVAVACGVTKNTDISAGVLNSIDANLLGIDITDSDTLVHMNDYRGMSFSDIAAYIEQNILSRYVSRRSATR